MEKKTAEGIQKKEKRKVLGRGDEPANASFNARKRYGCNTGRDRNGRTLIERTEERRNITEY